MPRQAVRASRCPSRLRQVQRLQQCISAVDEWLCAFETERMNELKRARQEVEAVRQRCRAAEERRAARARDAATQATAERSVRPSSRPPPRCRHAHCWHRAGRGSLSCAAKSGAPGGIGRSASARLRRRLAPLHRLRLLLQARARVPGCVSGGRRRSAWTACGRRPRWVRARTRLRAAASITNDGAARRRRLQHCPL